MKKLFYVLLILIPFIVSAQQDGYQSSPLDYIWQNVGNAGFSAGKVECTTLAFSPSGEPCVAYRDWGNSHKATVMKYNGTNWVNVGNAGFSAGDAWYTSLAFSPTGQPYVAYMDWANAQNATVMKFDSVFVGVNTLKNSRLSIYPNPATDKITVEISRETEGSKLFIVNVEGQVQLEQKITQSKTQIDISTLPSGVYFVRLTNEKTVEVGKIVKK
jgi:Secretion system C-terminal sorting domain